MHAVQVAIPAQQRLGLKFAMHYLPVRAASACGGLQVQAVLPDAASASLRQVWSTGGVSEKLIFVVRGSTSIFLVAQLVS